MTDLASVRIYLLIADAIGRSDPFDTEGAIALLESIGSGLQVPMAAGMIAAIDAGTTAASPGDARTSSLVSYALARVAIALEMLLVPAHP